MNITISEDIKKHCPQFTAATLLCEVTNSETSVALWAEMEAEIKRFAGSYKIEDVNKRPAIAATRKLYKDLGKDPNRYRPSAEALCRRIVRGIEIYRVNTLVDIINIVSIRSGYSIGGFDADKIRGKVELGVGRGDDKFEAIGRGLLNVENLPLYRDETGGIGTPTSDHERTKLSLETTRLFVIVNGYSGKDGLQEAMDFLLDLLKKYASLGKYETHYI
jgi:DNA/RNA-binding domain of Phe-tRNA-synthetase-like protein